MFEVCTWDGCAIDKKLMDVFLGLFTLSQSCRTLHRRNIWSWRSVRFFSVLFYRMRYLNYFYFYIKFGQRCSGIHVSVELFYIYIGNNKLNLFLFFKSHVTLISAAYNLSRTLQKKSITWNVSRNSRPSWSDPVIQFFSFSKKKKGFMGIIFKKAEKNIHFV